MGLLSKPSVRRRLGRREGGHRDGKKGPGYSCCGTYELKLHAIPILRFVSSLKLVLKQPGLLEKYISGRPHALIRLNDNNGALHLYY